MKNRKKKKLNFFLSFYSFVLGRKNSLSFVLEFILIFLAAQITVRGRATEPDFGNDDNVDSAHDVAKYPSLHANDQ